MEIYLSPWILLPLPSLIIFYQHCLRDYQKLQTKTKILTNISGMKTKNATLLHQWDGCNCIVCNTNSPLHIHKFIPQEVWKAFNVGINAWNITAVLHSNGDRNRWLFSFSWRFFLIHLKVCETLQACYCCWFNWRNSITCTHCNVISLKHDSILWQAKSQRINVDITTFHLLWQLFIIIKIFSSPFELDWKKLMPKTNQIWTVYVLWGC